MKHLIFWDLPDDRRLSHALADHHGDFVITPMSYAATLTCRKYFTDHYLPFETIIPTLERKRLFTESSGIIDRFYAGISRYAPLWCHAISAYSLAHSVYYTLLAHLFVTNTRKMHPNAHFVMYKPLGLALMPNLSREAYNWFSDVLGIESLYASASRREMINCVISRSVSSFYPKQARKASGSKGKRAARDAVKVDVLLVALEESDRRNQTPLAQRIGERRDITAHWLAVEGDQIGLSADEAQLNKNTESGLKESRVARGGRTQGGGAIRYRSLKMLAMKGWLYAALRHAFGERIPSRICWRMAVRFAYQQNNLEERYLTVQQLLGAYKPKVMVVNSFLQAMRSVQLEAERRTIPMVLLPHGVSDLQGPEVYWRADAVGRFGRLERDMLADHLPERQDTFHATGGGHMGYMAMHQGEICSDWPEGRLAILFPTTIPHPFRPHSPWEIMEDADMLVRAGLMVGAKTVVRCHPRQKHHNYFDYEMMLEGIDPAGWALSDGSDSLVASLSYCHIVVVSYYSGAVLQALYAPRPVVCWMPRPYLPFSDQILERFPCRATTQEELVAVYRRIQAEPDYRAELLQKQKELLAELVEDPYGDPYAGSEKLVMDMLRKVKDDETGLGGACGSSR